MSQLTISPLEAVAAAVTCAGLGAAAAYAVAQRSSGVTSTNLADALPRAAESELQRELTELQQQLTLERRTIAQERAGRTKAERALREHAQKAMTGVDGGSVSNGVATLGYPSLPVGYIEAPFVGRRGAPRQGALAPDLRAHLVFSPAIPASALHGLSNYSHVYVMFIFHENTTMHKDTTMVAGAASPASSDDAASSSGSNGTLGGSTKALDNALRLRPYSPLVEAPALKGEKVGVFASRSPHRPNAIGLSLCRLVAVHAGGGRWAKDGRRILVLAGCDLLHGTPVIDVKPYAPFDCPRCMGGLVLGRPHGAADDDAGDGDQAANITSLSPAGSDLVTATSPPLPSTLPFAPARDISAALLNLASTSDIHPSSFVRQVPEWVMVGLRDQSTARLPVVWSGTTVEDVKAAVAEDALLFYGPTARRRQLPSASSALGSSMATVAGGAGGASKRGNGVGAPKIAAELDGIDTADGAEVDCCLRAITQVLALDIRAVRHGRGSGYVVPASKATMERGGIGAEPREQRAGVDGSGAGTPRPMIASTHSAASPAASTYDAAAISPRQWYEMYFDTLHVRFTVRELPTDNAHGDGDAEAVMSTASGSRSAKSDNATKGDIGKPTSYASTGVTTVATAASADPSTGGKRKTFGKGNREVPTGVYVCVESVAVVPRSRVINAEAEA